MAAETKSEAAQWRIADEAVVPKGFARSDECAIDAGNGRYLIWHPIHGFNEAARDRRPHGWHWLAFAKWLQPADSSAR